uniref:RING-CH-type domain-containing protein n=1 Tax=Chenopodium quinoa TaxID=63459 RepID=A0A803M9T4_CHEQI
MQLASNGSRGEDDSETEPILSDSHIIEESQETTLYEIRTVDCDTSAVTDIEADENCSLVNPEQPQCRICLEIEGEDLIAPCHCKGTQKYVHRSCLDNWRSTKIVAVLGILVYKFYGEELREMFGYQEHPYAFYIMAVLAIILVGLLYGFFIAIICGQRINERHHHVLAKQELTKPLDDLLIKEMSTISYHVTRGFYCTVLLLALSFCEYIVEDRESKDVPELDPSHISELRMLGLY